MVICNSIVSALDVWIFLLWPVCGPGGKWHDNSFQETAGPHVKDVTYPLNIFLVKSATVPDVSFVDGAIKSFNKVVKGDSPCLSITYDADSLAERAKLRNGDPVIGIYMHEFPILKLGDGCIAPLFVFGDGHKSDKFIRESTSHKVHLFDEGHIWIQTDGSGAHDEVHDHRYKLEYRFHWRVLDNDDLYVFAIFIKKIYESSWKP
ncbi:hypothetical protein C8J56DRAFT_888966 [Mycena floridula]|nr:hypothetical protein C8J56DRAFT_888966 [Mycena floridula]